MNTMNGEGGEGRDDTPQVKCPPSSQPPKTFPRGTNRYTKGRRGANGLCFLFCVFFKEVTLGKGAEEVGQDKEDGPPKMGNLKLNNFRGWGRGEIKVKVLFNKIPDSGNYE